MLKDIDGLLEEIIQVSEQQINEQNTVKIIFF
jgi:hypothetical protein